jgi:hypothetical protein
VCRAWQQIEQHADTQMQEWAVQSSATLDLQDRLQTATQLMSVMEASFRSRQEAA